MKHFLAAFLSALILAGCKEDEVALPKAVEMTEASLGYYCQMDLFNHDGPKGQIHLDGVLAPLFFAQIRDAVAYLHMPEQSHAVTVAYVQNMDDVTDWATPGAWIPLLDAYFVIGSSQMGGMGAPEFVPFSSQDAAETFALEFGGTVLPFEQIETEDVLIAAAPDNVDHEDPDIAGRLRALSPPVGSN